MGRIIYFYMLWWFIGAVSSFDIYLTIRFSDNLAEYEQNPIARMILENDGWDVSRFVAIKMFMTILVLGILVKIFKYFNRYSNIVITCIALCQLWLLVYLIYYWHY